MKTQFNLTHVLLFFASLNAQASSLTLSEYIQQVTRDNANIQSAQDGSSGASLRSSEANLIYSPQLVFESEFVNDHRTNPMFPTAYRKVRNDSYTLGLEQLTPFGLKGGVYYNLLRQHYVEAMNGEVFFEGRPRVELSLSLLRNGLGSETRAQSEAQIAGARAAQFAESYKSRLIRSEAEIAFIKLATIRELKKMDQASLDRAEEILSWATHRTKVNLGEQSDLLQAQANLEAKRLQLQNTDAQERTARRDFNRLRGLDSDRVDEILPMPPGEVLEIPDRRGVRDDVKAAQENAKFAAAQAELGKQRNRPVLEIYGSYGRNSRSAEWGTALSEGVSSDRPTSVWGLRLRTPIAFGSQGRAIQGYELEKIAASRQVDQKTFEQEIEWKDLCLRFAEAKRRYEIAKELSEIQRRKAENERKYLKRGRTTTYQSLIFEQDYIQAESLRIQARSSVLEIHSRLKLFGAQL